MTNIEINPETGLPTLPDGYRWRIESRNGAQGYYLCIEGREKYSRHRHGTERHGFLWLRTRPKAVDSWYNEYTTTIVTSPEDAYIYGDLDRVVTDLTAVIILENALVLYKEFLYDQQWKVDLERNKAFIGIYPPKTLLPKS